MKLYLTFITIIVAFFFTDAKAQVQSRQDSLNKAQKVLTPRDENQRRNNYYRRSLNIDSAKADQVVKIYDYYKAGMKALEGQNFSLEERRVRVESLMEEKNEKLRAMLTPAQQEKIIPPNERELERKLKKD